MSLSPSRAAYEDCFELLERALAAKGGIRVSAERIGEAHQLLSRLNYARVMARQESREIYTPDHPKHGISPYDTLIVRMPREEDERWWIYIEPRRVVGEVQELAAE